MGKVTTLKKLLPEVLRLQKSRKKIGFCNGNYDLLHPGHVRHFESAKKMCDVLIVAVASDKQVRRQKGRGRPIYNHDLRMYMISQLAPVDYVLLNEENNGVSFISLLKPTLYIRGPDYASVEPNPEFQKEINSAAAVGCAVRFTRDPKLATREIVKAIKEGKSYKAPTK